MCWKITIYDFSAKIVCKLSTNVVRSDAEWTGKVCGARENSRSRECRRYAGANCTFFHNLAFPQRGGVRLDMGLAFAKLKTPPGRVKKSYKPRNSRWEFRGSSRGKELVSWSRDFKVFFSMVLNRRSFLCSLIPRVFVAVNGQWWGIVVFVVKRKSRNVVEIKKFSLGISRLVRFFGSMEKKLILTSSRAWSFSERWFRWCCIISRWNCWKFFLSIFPSR